MADFTIPEETRLLLEGIRGFVRAELDHPYGRDGRYLPPILEAKREIRMASAAAGYYPMFVRRSPRRRTTSAPRSPPGRASSLMIRVALRDAATA